MDDTRRELLELLIQVSALRFGNFTLKSSRSSPYYCDLKYAATFPSVLRMVSDLLVTHLADETLIAGVELGAVPYTVALALSADRPYLIVRKVTKSHGTAQPIEGAYSPGDSVLLIEDVATSGGSIRDAITALRRAGLRIARAVCIVDREEGAREALAKIGVELSHLLTARDLLAESRPKLDI